MYKGSAQFEDDPFAAFSKYRECEPFWCESGGFDDGGFWVFTRYDAVREIQQDYRTFLCTQPAKWWTHR